MAGLLGPAPRTAAQWTGFARIDWQATERHHFTLEGIGADWNAPGGGLTRVSETYGNHSFGSSQASQQWLLARWEAYLTPNLLAVTQGSAGRDDPERAARYALRLRAGISRTEISRASCRRSSWIRATDSPSAILRASARAATPTNGSTTRQEMVDWVHNQLLVKAGFELDHNADATSLLRNQTGTYHYSKVAELYLRCAGL